MKNSQNQKNVCNVAANKFEKEVLNIFKKYKYKRIFM